MDPELLTPTPKPDRQIQSFNDVSLLLVDLEEWGDQNASKIVAIDQVIQLHTEAVNRHNCEVDPARAECG